MEHVEKHPPESAERNTRGQVLIEKARNLGTALRQLFGNCPSPAERHEIARMVYWASRQLVLIPASTTGSHLNSPDPIEVYNRREEVRWHARIVLSEFYGRDPWHRSKCWRCGWSVNAARMDRCLTCMWVMCHGCGAGEGGAERVPCPACTGKRR